MNIHQWRQQVKDFNKSFEDHPEILEQWKENTVANFSRFSKNNSIWSLEWKYYRENEKAMVLVGSSDRLREDVVKLHDINENFCIVCANSSLKFLLKNKIVPDYCISLDSDDIDIPRHLDIDRDDVTLLASSVTNPCVLDAWNGPIYFMPYYSKVLDSDLKKRVRSRLGKSVHGGGNSMTQALYVVSIIFGSKTVVFVGNEYCFDDRKTYYADKSASKQERMKTLVSCVDVLGRERWTKPDLYNYATWTEKICRDLSPPGFFIDTSFGLLGKDCPAMHIMDLSDAIVKVKEAFELRDKLNTAKTNEERKMLLDEHARPVKQSEVYRYDMHSQYERLLQFARS